MEKGMLYFRPSHAGPQIALETCDLERSEILRVLKALSALVDCGCCLPCWRGEDGSEIDLPDDPPCPHLPGELCAHPAGPGDCPGIAEGSCGCPSARWA